MLEISEKWGSTIDKLQVSSELSVVSGLATMQLSEKSATHSPADYRVAAFAFCLARRPRVAEALAEAQALA
jgi:hypothetical protein